MQETLSPVTVHHEGITSSPFDTLVAAKKRLLAPADLPRSPVPAFYIIETVKDHEEDEEEAMAVVDGILSALGGFVGEMVKIGKGLVKSV